MENQNPSTEQERDSEPPTPPVNNDEPKPVRDDSGNKQRDSNRSFRIASLTMDVLMLVAVATYSVFAILQWRAMRGQLDQMKISTDANKRAADAAASAADSAEQSLRLTDDSIQLARKNTELSQKNIEIAQANLEAVQRGLQYQGKATEISQTELEKASTPLLDVSVTSIRFENALAIYAMRNTVEVRFSIQNHSDAAATKVFAQCFLEKQGALETVAGLSKKDLAVMPHQTANLRAAMFTANGHIGAAVIDLVDSGKLGIKVYVSFFTSLGKKRDFIETFYKSGGKFTTTNTEFDPPEKEISDLFSHSISEPFKR